MSTFGRLKDKKFQETLISIGFVCVLLYEGISVMLYFSAHTGAINIIDIISIPSTMVCIVAIPVLFLVWKISKGAKINIPSDLVAKPKQKQPPQQYQRPVIGTWICPSCGNLAKGDVCIYCGRPKQ